MQGLDFVLTLYCFEVLLIIMLIQEVDPCLGTALVRLLQQVS